MKKTLQIILILIICMPTIGKCQTDSTETFKLNDNYLEIKSLRHILTSSNFHERNNSWKLITTSLIPKPPILKSGTVIIKDRQNKLIALYIFSDSTIVHEDHYSNGRLSRQVCNYSKDTVIIEKYYWDNGNLKHLLFYLDRKQIIYDYSENGQLIIGQKNNYE